MNAKKMIEKELNDKINSINDVRKKRVIETIISKDEWYKKIDFDSFISIMLDLNYSIEDAKSIYVIFNTNKNN